jgi:hypothetical protein
MRRRVWLVLLALISAAFPAWAGCGTCDDDFTADSCLGSANALTAVGRLGPVRMVVYDPVSNSFAFVIPCSDALSQGGMSTEDIRNRQYLDGHRLTLTTQKIRLFIMPYNPLDGSLTLQDSRSQGGVEFTETPVASLPKVPEAKQTADSAPGNAPPPEVPSMVKKGSLKQTLINALSQSTKKPVSSTGTKNSGGKKASASNAAVQNTPSQLDSQRVIDQIGDLEKAIENWNIALGRVNSAMAQLQFDSNCVHTHIQEMPIKISRKLSTEGRTFSLAQDVSLAALKVEAQRRTKLLESESFESCFASSQTLEQDAKSLEKTFLEVSGKVNDLETLTESLSDLVQKLKVATPPSGFTADTWKEQVAPYQDTATAFEDHEKEIEAERNDLLQQVDNTRGEADNFKMILNSSAFQLQRYIYNPLANGESITFVVTRGEVKSADGKTTVVAKQTNTLELRSAPVYTIRFGTGIIVSGLRDPSFKAGPDPNDAKKKTILFDDQGQNQVLPALFVHHYWGWRSPLLTPTRFERFMPTVSLGVPLAKTDVLQQVLFGLDWELMPGLDLNLGAHWGKVNALNNGYQVGDPIPSTFDITTIQQKRFRTAFYGGIVLNTDSFASFFGQRQ